MVRRFILFRPGSEESKRATLVLSNKKPLVPAGILSWWGSLWLIMTLAELGMVPPAIGEILGQVDLKTITEIYMRSTEAKRNEILGQVNAALTSPPVEVGDLDKKRAERASGGKEKVV